jgi:hypothetical protein
MFNKFTGRGSEQQKRVHISKMEESGVGVGFCQDENRDKTEPDNHEENTSPADILPGFKTFEEFREVRQFLFIYLQSNLC